MMSKPYSNANADEDRGQQTKEPSFWEAIRRFRRKTDLAELDIDEVYSDVRDRTPSWEP